MELSEEEPVGDLNELDVGEYWFVVEEGDGILKEFDVGDVALLLKELDDGFRFDLKLLPTPVVSCSSNLLLEPNPLGRS